MLVLTGMLPGVFMYLPERCGGMPFCSVQGTMVVMYYIYFDVARHCRGQNGSVRSDDELN